MNILTCKSMNFNCIIMVLYITYSHAEDPLDQFNWKNVSISYQRNWMRYVQKLLEINLETNKVIPLYLLCVNQNKNYQKKNVKGGVDMLLF